MTALLLLLLHPIIEIGDFLEMYFMKHDAKGKKRMLESQTNTYMKYFVEVLSEKFVEFPVNGVQINDYIRSHVSVEPESNYDDLNRLFQNYHIRYLADCYKEWKKGDTSLDIEKLRKNRSFEYITQQSEKADELFFMDAYLLANEKKWSDTKRMKFRLKRLLKAIR